MARADRVVRTHLRRQFLITMKSGQSWKALLLDADLTTLVLVNAEAIAPDGTTTVADGSIYLPRCDVAYMQSA